MYVKCGYHWPKRVCMSTSYVVQKQHNIFNTTYSRSCVCPITEFWKKEGHQHMKRWTYEKLYVLRVCVCVNMIKLCMCLCVDVVAMLRRGSHTPSCWVGGFLRTEQFQQLIECLHHKSTIQVWVGNFGNSMSKYNHQGSNNTMGALNVDDCTNNTMGVLNVSQI